MVVDKQPLKWVLTPILAAVPHVVCFWNSLTYLHNLVSSFYLKILFFFFKPSITASRVANWPFEEFITAPARSAVPNIFGTRDWFYGRQFFHGPGWGRWFQDDSSTLHLLCISFLLLWHQLHFRSSGIRIQSLGIPKLDNNTWHGWDSILQHVVSHPIHGPVPPKARIVGLGIKEWKWDWSSHSSPGDLLAKSWFPVPLTLGSGCLELWRHSQGRNIFTRVHVLVLLIWELILAIWSCAC